MDTAGRVEKFRKKYGDRPTAVSKKKKEVKKEEPKKEEPSQEATSTEV